MKLPTKPHAPTPGPDVGYEVGDGVFFQHPEIGPHSGCVVAKGKDGCTLKDAKGDKHKVYWEHVLGHKYRANVEHRVVDIGDAGAILENDKGERRFVAGYEPHPEAGMDSPGEDADADDMAQLKRDVAEATKPKRLAKSFGDAPVLFCFKD